MDNHLIIQFIMILKKNQIRKEVRRIRKSMSDEEFQDLSGRIYDHLFSPSFSLPERIGIYVSYGHEVDTIHMIQQLLLLHKKVYVPKITGKRKMEFYRIESLKDLVPGYMGILEPINNHQETKNNIEMMITPLVAFDEQGNRIGQGGGYYDVYFQNYSGIKVGIAFDFQKYEFESEEFDQKLDIVITENGINRLSISKNYL